MSWDIQGNPLPPGHCEVHPEVAETYPCHIDREQDNAQREAYQYDHDAYHQEQDAYYRAMEEQQEDDRLAAIKAEGDRLAVDKAKREHELRSRGNS